MRVVHSAARRSCRHGSFGVPFVSRGLPSHASCEYGEWRCTMPRAAVRPRALQITRASGRPFSHAGTLSPSLPPHAAQRMTSSSRLIAETLYPAMADERRKTQRLQEPDHANHCPHGAMVIADRVEQHAADERTERD